MSTHLPQIEPRELAARLSGENPPCVLDIREAWELELAKLASTVDIPMDELPNKLDTLKAHQGTGDLVVMCHSGVRSAMVVQFLQQNGFSQVINLVGGIHAWSEQVDKEIPRY